MDELSPSIEQILTLSLLIGAVLVHTAFIPQTIGYLIALGVLASITLVCLTHGTMLRIPRYALGSLIFIWLIYLGHFAIQPNSSMAQRVPVFIGATGILIFLLPRTVPSSTLLSSASRLGGVLVVISIPAYIVPGLTFGQWHATVGILSGLGIQVPIMDSVIRNPNTLAAICFVGLVGSVRELSIDHSKVSGLWFALNGLGTILVDSYAILLAVIAGIGITLAVSMNSTAALRGGVLAGVLGVAVATFSILVSVASVSPLLEQVLGGRVTLWRAAAAAWSEQPFFGYGATNTASVIEPFLHGDYRQPTHSIVARMFITAGIFGGVAYCMLYIRAIWDATAVIGSRSYDDTFFILVAFIGLVIFDLFNGVSIFGLSLPSILLAWTLGFLLDSSALRPPQAET